MDEAIQREHEERGIQIDELISMLHEMYALAVDASGYDNAEKRDIKLRASMLLHKHGVEV